MEFPANPITLCEHLREQKHTNSRYFIDISATKGNSKKPEISKTFCAIPQHLQLSSLDYCKRWNPMSKNACRSHPVNPDEQAGAKVGIAIRKREKPILAKRQVGPQIRHGKRSSKGSTRRSGAAENMQQVKERQILKIHLDIL